MTVFPNGTTSSARRWVSFELPPYATQGVYCHACGAMIPRRYWTTGAGAGAGAGARAAAVYCGPACEELERRVEALRDRFREPSRPAAAHEP